MTLKFDYYRKKIWPFSQLLFFRGFHQKPIFFPHVSNSPRPPGKILYPPLIRIVLEGPTAPPPPLHNVQGGFLE